MERPTEVIVKPMDCFIAHGPSTHSYRTAIAATCLTFWAAQVRAGRARCIVYDLCPGGDAELWETMERRGLRGYFQVDRRSAEGSQRLRHAWAADEASSEICLSVDDDLVLLERPQRVRADDPIETWNEHFLRLFHENDDLVMCTARPQPGGTNPLTLGKDAPTHPDLWPLGCIGGVRAIRAGVIRNHNLPQLDPQNGGGYDTTLSQFLNQPAPKGIGRLIAQAYRLEALHHGWMASTVWSEAPLGLWDDPAA